MMDDGDRVRVDLAASDPELGPDDEVAVALRAQSAAWRLRDALSTADWCRFNAGMLAMVDVRRRSGR